MLVRKSFLPPNLHRCPSLGAPILQRHGKILRRFSVCSTYSAIFAMNFVSSAQPVFIDGGQSAFNEPGQRLANS